MNNFFIHGNAGICRKYIRAGLVVITGTFSTEGLNRLSPKAQKTFLQACATTIGHDGLTTDVEFQILRSVAAVLGCPLPPLL